MFTSIRIVIRKTFISTLRLSYCTFPTNVQSMSVSSVELNNTSRLCLLKDEKGSVIGTYPYAWLRDNCRCSKCFHPSSRGRLVLMANLDPDIIPAKAEVNVTDQELRIQWANKHSSHFPLDWLWENRFSQIPDEGPVSAPNQQFWGTEMQKNLPTFSYNDVQGSGTSLHDWIEAMQIYGLALIKGAPKQEAVRAIGNRISFLKPQSFG